MKIRMLTTSCGPDSKFNFDKNQIRDVSEEEAKYWHDRKLCELIDDFKEPPKPSSVGVEKAVVVPSEKTTGWSK